MSLGPNQSLYLPGKGSGPRNLNMKNFQSAIMDINNMIIKERIVQSRNQNLINTKKHKNMVVGQMEKDLNKITKNKDL